MSANSKHAYDTVPRVELHNGDCLDQSEFHRLYEKMPEGFRAELVDDLHKKKERYEQSGVLEYIVVCLKPLQLHWFDLRQKQDFAAAGDGVFRSKVFPGLWIHEDALLKRDYKLSMDVLQQGLAADEHEQFVTLLAGRHANGER